MTSLRTRPLLIAVLAILAIGVAAATLNSAVPAQGAIGTGPVGDVGDADDGGRGPDQGPGGFPLSLGFGEGIGGIPFMPLPCLTILNDPRVLLAIAAIAAIALYALYRQLGPIAPVGLFFALAPVAVLIHSILTACTDVELPDGGTGSGTGGNATFSIGLSEMVGGGAGGGGLPTISAALIIILGTALVVAVVLLFRSTGDQTEPADEPVEADVDEDSMMAIGEAAGEAADRIEASAEADNEIYRAWREMTTYLDVPNPESSTPTEFADAAIEIGMDRDDVTELTDLFAAVRYGTTAPTEDREARAVVALRGIQATYAGDSE